MGNIISIRKTQPAIADNTMVKIQKPSLPNPSKRPFFSRVKPSTASTASTAAGKYWSVQDFFKSIASKESSNRYNVTGPKIIKGTHSGHRALGKYQFMPKTLKSLGYNVTPEQFLKDTKLQEEAMRKLTEMNARSLGIKDLNRLNERQIKALSIAHYAGVGKARKFYLQNKVTPNFIRAQTTTGQNFDSILQYAQSVYNSLNKTSSVNKADYIINKLLNREV